MKQYSTPVDILHACFFKGHLIRPIVNAEYVLLYIKVSYSSQVANIVNGHLINISFGVLMMIHG